MQSLRQCWTLGRRMSTETCAELQKEADEVATQRGKTSTFPRKLRERLISVTGAHSMNRVFCTSSRVSTALCWTGYANAENSVVLYWRERRNRKFERERAIGEYEAMLNSSLGKGIIDTGCAKMMMGSDTFKQYLDLLTSKERASVEKVLEKNRFRFGDNETRMSHWSAVIPMNIGNHVCREKVAIILGDAPFLMSKPFLQRMGAVLDLEKGQVTFNKLGVTMNLGESSTGHHVTDLISDCETLTIAPGSVIKHSEESVQDPGINIENSELSNLLCGSKRVTVFDVNKHRISLVGADCEQSCGRWTIGNFADDSGVFVIKDDCCKNQQTLLPGPWTGRTIIEERCDEFEGHVSCLTREEEVLRGAECVLVQPRICATKTGPTGQKQRMFQEEDGFDFRDAATRRLISAELRRFSPDSVTVHLLDVVCRSGFFLSRISRRYVASANLWSLMCAV